jgi:uncharacterized RDD family membrane protein YckC
MMRAVSIEGSLGASPEDLVVATPERVAFRFETAGLGSRFAAQLVDLLVLSAVMVALGLVAFGIAGLTGSSTAAELVFVVVGFLLFWAYWILPEALWSGRTLGKHLLHLRVVDARGGPLTAGQAIVRNLLRIVDFLPTSYAVGAVVMFASPRNQRLGDLAAGTVVVREVMAVRLRDLAGEPPSGVEVAGAALAAGIRPPPRLEPRLRRFVQAYAQRRPGLAPERRAELAREAEAALRGALPDVVEAAGPLAALDQLADRMLG